MGHPRRIEGFAIVSQDGMLANAAGIMPESLKFTADQRFFEAGLDAVDVVVHGRHSHEQQPHSALRRRLILSRRVPAIAADPANEKALIWNPAGASFEEALAARASRTLGSALSAPPPCSGCSWIATMFSTCRKRRACVFPEGVRYSRKSPRERRTRCLQRMVWKSFGAGCSIRRQALSSSAGSARVHAARPTSLGNGGDEQNAPFCSRLSLRPSPRHALREPRWQARVLIPGDRSLALRSTPCAACCCLPSSR